jgi:hypothetical protein
MKPDHYFFVADPQALATTGEPNPTLRFRILEDQGGGRWARTEKYIHLELSTNFAMQLLGGLMGLQKHFGLPDPTAATMIHVPPAKDRH